MTEEDKRTKEVLSRVDKYLSLLRYGYSSQEKLQRLKVLEDYYKSINKTSTDEVLVSNIDFAEQLSGKLILPLKVKGIFLKEGRHQTKYYTKEEMESSTYNPINASFPLMLDHEDRKAGSIIGKVTKVEYDPSIPGLRWWGHINDETHARNVLDGVAKEVSATIYSTTDYDDEYGVIGKDLVFKELSIVMEGAVKGNTLEVDK